MFSIADEDKFMLRAAKFQGNRCIAETAEKECLVKKKTRRLATA